LYDTPTLRDIVSIQCDRTPVWYLMGVYNTIWE
jgi:hypothetical protein